MNPQVGVLALQGDYQAHARMLGKLGVAAREVRHVHELQGLHGLILPGGESTTMWTFLDKQGLSTALVEFAQQGGALYGTCAGVILLARQILLPERSGLGILDVTVERNGYGRQLDSSIQEVEVDGGPVNIEIVLIRAPRIVEMGPDVVTRLRWNNDPIWVEQSRIMGTTFHPELGTDNRFHRRFLELAQQAQQAQQSLPSQP
jgi:5'-phosphate synthase pdxT subunit